MKTKLLILLSLLILGRLYGQTSATKDNQKRSKVVTDIYNRVIIDSQGNRIEYAPNDTILELKKQKTAKGSQSKNNPEKNIQNNCEEVWKYSIMGTAIGRRSMNSIDLDHDGKVEVVCSAKSGTWNSFWYTMKYDEINNTYRQSWISDVYEDNITSIKVFDINNDSEFEIIVGFENGHVIIFNGDTKSIIGQFSLPLSDGINDIEFGDADNDSFKEIAISTDNKIYLYNPLNLSLESQLSYGAFDFKIGNVDNDVDNEIVTTLGKVLHYSGSITTLKWTYDGTTTSDNSLMVELSDIDSDGMKEIISAKRWYSINVYDADTQSQKYQITTSHDIEALLLKDINNDGTEEIIYGDGQWGEIHCINSTTHTQIWQINNPDAGVTAINVADINNDGTLEVMWGAGWTSTGADYFYVADISTNLIEWTSVAIDGPFYAVAVDDIDNDGTNEIVAISYDSESGYSSGILTVFNALTKEIEWQSNGTFFNNVLTGIYDVKVKDIDNDGIKEVVVAAEQTYTGKIWIVDGVTKAIKSSHLFNTENLSEFKVLELDDVDNDGIIEIIATTSSNYYIINPSDFSIEYSSDNLTSGYNPVTIKTDVSNFGNGKKIVICNNCIYVREPLSQNNWKTIESNYSAMDLYDLNGDGKKEIIAGTSEGTIKIFDGITHQVTFSRQLSNYKIDGIVVSKLNGDTIPEFIFTSNGSVNFYSDTNQLITTKKYDQTCGAYNSLKVVDLDNDASKEILVGTPTYILQISKDCYKCLWFNTEKIIDNAACVPQNNGKITLIPNGISPYNYQWSTGASDSIISNLSPGIYVVTVTDNSGCAIVDTLNVQQSQLIADYISTNESCLPAHDGTASVNIIQGTAPFSYQWSVDSTSSAISNLNFGNYSVTVTDSKNCTSNHLFYVQKDYLDVFSSKTDVACFGMQNGSIQLYTYGSAPYDISWNNGQSGSSLYNLGVGTYIVNVTDSHGCSSNDTVIISQPAEILSQTTTTPDNINSPFGDGTANVNIIGGATPYHVQWNDPFLQTTVTAINLQAGTYYVTITDNYGCIKTDMATVSSYVNINEIGSLSPIRVYPNPATDYVLVDSKDLSTNASIRIYDTFGRMVINQPINGKVSVKNLSNGIYFYTINNDGKVATGKLIVE